jgi:prepilin-type N-terminal cleavage/methylation domain-containing protein
MATKRKLRGFTLVELLISITILGLVIGLATFTFSLFSHHWDGPKSNFDRSSGQMQRVDLLSRALNDALPWLVKDESGRPGFYFLGREEGLTLVTASPIYSVGAPAVIRIFREPDGNDRWRLVYEEASLSGLLLRRGSQVLPFSHRLVILEQQPKIAFRYFGWESMRARISEEKDADANLHRWWDEYDGLTREQQPQFVAIKLGQFEAIFSMPERTQTLLNRASPES